MSQTQTMTEAAPQKKSRNPMLFSISEKNETAFKIKQLATGLHFVSLVVMLVMHVIEHEQFHNCLMGAVILLALAIFIPPTGLISPDEAPESLKEYTKNSMSYMPTRDAAEAEVKAPKSKSKTKAGKKKN